MASYRPVNAVVRALDVLAIVNQLKGRATVAEIYRYSSIDKATIVRMLETLIYAGYVVRNEQHREYEVTGKALLLSSGYEKSRSIAAIVNPLLTDFREQIGWPSDVAVFDRDGMIVVETSREGGPLFFNRTAGFKAPMLGTSLGLAYTTFCDEQERKLILEAARDNPAPWNDLARDARLADASFAQIRKQGYAVMHPSYSREQYRNMIDGIGVPIMKNSVIFASINVIFLKTALSRDQAVKDLLPLLQKNANTMAEEIARRWWV